MATKDEILTRLLKEENYVSGEELARQTGVSHLIFGFKSVVFSIALHTATAAAVVAVTAF